ncbi:lymphokine-activated killer T-cell-originated protein kinase homolog [Zerene cesonia]|uniref:lymphokine-activated killer T-cell-originated protein kinase homolog n=1 Tax=Zerene cesonia TaxID=33412 RepID=UPI0018E4E6C2|nr:lymphokine-activated killer T-cell-originated protein kinase homolog [Zerene cesonia]
MSEFKTPVKSKLLSDGAEKREITIPPSPFLNRLGYGTGVSVMQLVRSPKAGQIRSPWALKMLNKRVKPNKVYTERLQAEAELLQKMSHPNIVGFRAFSKTKILYLGMEACDLSLGDMIERRVEDGLEAFPPNNIIKVALDIGSALDYLHTKMQILHGDMKSYNILVNGAFVVCKLCDFGVTLPLNENGVFDKENAGKKVYYGTEAWSAPEVLEGDEISSKTDIWPLGLTLWEMMSLHPPHTQIDENFDESLEFDDSYVDNNFELYGTRPAIPATVSVEEYSEPISLFQACTETEPSRRPSAGQLASIAGTMVCK